MRPVHGFPFAVHRPPSTANLHPKRSKTAVPTQTVNGQPPPKTRSNGSSPPAPLHCTMPLFLLLLCISLTTPPQPSNLDVGSFTILREGSRVGREQFSLRRVSSPDGIEFELRAESAIGERRLATRLETDSAGTPMRYSAEVREGTGVVLKLGGQRVRGRFATLARTDRGEAAREYLLPAGTLVLEDQSFHQAALLWLSRERLMDVPRSALAPMDNSERTVRVTLDEASDTVVVAGVRLPAQRWVVDDSRNRRVIWTDADGRILRVTIPSLGLEAVRDDVPRY